METIYGCIDDQLCKDILNPNIHAIKELVGIFFHLECIPNVNLSTNSLFVSEIRWYIVIFLKETNL